MPTSSKSANKTPWTKADDEILRSIMMRGTSQSWAEIAQEGFIDDRHTATACLDRWKALSRPRSQKGPWTPSEDAALVLLVEQEGPEKWVQIATKLTSRSGKQCRERWHNHLDPNIKKGPFSPEEDAIIFDLYSKIGSKWAEMARILPGRPDNAIKNHFNTSLQRSKRRNSTVSSTSANSSTSSHKTGSPKPATRYSPYKSRKRTDSVASTTNAPASPSPLSPHSALSRSASPTDVRPSHFLRRPPPGLSLGRNLDKDFFSPARHATTGFVAHGPLTAPADDRFSWSLPASFDPSIDPALQQDYAGAQGMGVHIAQGGDEYFEAGMHDAGGYGMAAHDPLSHSSTSLTHSLSATSLAYSSSSCSPSTPSPGITALHPMFTAEDYDHYTHRFAFANVSPPRPIGLQRTNSLPCYPTTPPSPPDGHAYLPQHHFSPLGMSKIHPNSSLNVEISYQPSDISTYFQDPDLDRMPRSDIFMTEAPFGITTQEHLVQGDEDARQLSPDKSAGSPTPEPLHGQVPYGGYEGSHSPPSPNTTISASEYGQRQSALMISPGSLTFNEASRAMSAALPGPDSPLRSTPSMHQVLSTPQQLVHEHRRRHESSPGAMQDASVTRSSLDSRLSPASHAPDYMGSPSAMMFHPVPKRVPSFFTTTSLDAHLVHQHSSSKPTHHQHALRSSHRLASEAGSTV